MSRSASIAPGRSLRTAPDDRLVARLRDGDERGFEVIYDRYHLPLLSFCRHMLGTREEAEDALQQVFLSAHAQLVGDARPVQLRAWLYAIARNRCLSMLRARRDTVALDALPEPTGDGLAVGTQVQQRQDLRDMLTDLAQLPDDQRAALVLAELDDLSHDEIAVALEVRKDKVKALVFQAREALLGYRTARDADCGDIREQLATLRGGALRRTALQRHVAVCPGCAAFKAEVSRQRAALGAVLPVIPALGLRGQILEAVQAASMGAGVVGAAAATGGAAVGVATGVGAGASGTGAAATAGASAVAAAGAASGLAAKALVVAAVAVSAGGGAVAIEHGTDHPASRSAPVARPTPIAAPAAAAGRTPTTGPAASSAAAAKAVGPTGRRGPASAGSRAPGRPGAKATPGNRGHRSSGTGSPKANGSAGTKAASGPARGRGNGGAPHGGTVTKRGPSRQGGTLQSKAAKKATGGKPPTTTKPAPKRVLTPAAPAAKAQATRKPEPSAVTTERVPRPAPPKAARDQDRPRGAAD